MLFFLLEVFCVDSLILWQQTIKLSPQRALGSQVFLPLAQAGPTCSKRASVTLGHWVFQFISSQFMLFLSYNETPRNPRRLLVRTKQK